ncbi:MAG: phospho-N-acetylmuramoyl-pentapeptide-transferase [Bacteroides sp.]|nr:MAG: phospho-N-acetylmuramoyl-pentapeptide-transferase [Bacteroides sp.]
MNIILIKSLISILLSAFIVIFLGKIILQYIYSNNIILNKKNNDLNQKKIPIIGGFIILISILTTILILSNYKNIYIIIMLITTIWLGLTGLIDDLFKIQSKGVNPFFKIISQAILGLIIGLIICLNDNISFKEHKKDYKYAEYHHYDRIIIDKTQYRFYEKNLLLNIFFFKKENIFYKKMFFILMTIIIIISTSNGSNLTDGLDGLLATISILIGCLLYIYTTISSSYILSNYFNSAYIPNIKELNIFISAFLGSCLGFLWYNVYPAKMFMGDTGSLTIGGIIAVVSILIRKEIFLPIYCGIFVIELISVIIQVSYFKYTKYKYKTGYRIFNMTPLHHHYQLNNIHESKITNRFIIINAILCVITIIISL